MADLRSVTYGSNTFTIPTYDDSALSARVTANETAITAQDARIAALEALLAGHADVRLTLTGEGGTETAYDVLGKEYIAPPSTMFDMPAGAYDANGNLLASANEMSVAFEMEAEENTVDLYALDVTKLPAGTVGVILPAQSLWDSPPRIVTGVYNYSGRYFIENGTLDWLVFPASYSITTDLATPATMLSAIYYNGTDAGAPWGQTSAAINTTGLPLAWE